MCAGAFVYVFVCVCVNVCVAHVCMSPNVPSSLHFSLFLSLSPPSSSPSDEFVISPVEGELRVRRDVELDRETVSFYNITVTARDLGSPSRSSTVRRTERVERIR